MHLRYPPSKGAFQPLRGWLVQQSLRNQCGEGLKRYIWRWDTLLAMLGGRTTPPLRYKKSVLARRHGLRPTCGPWMQTPRQPW
jgi:hypothetical protein